MPNTIRILIIGVTLLGTASPALAKSINDKIVQYCKENVGAKVGDGECSALAHVALTQAGAKLEFKDQPNEGDYVWGKLVYTLEVVDNVQKKTTVPKMKIQPGDIIQLRDTKFVGKNYTAGYGHHTAVVVAVQKNGVIKVLEQNYNNQKFVVENAYRLNDLKAGWLRFYRPVAK